MEHSDTSFDPGDLVKSIEIRRICAKNGVFMSDDMERRMLQFARLLREANTRLNLISRKDVDNLWESHILHSLAILFEEKLPHNCVVLDLGSGGGLPGVPLTIVRPDISMILLDATRKKVEAVQAMVTELSLNTVEVLWGRAEDPLTVEKVSDRCDVVVARAVAPLKNLVSWSRVLVRRKRSVDGKTPHLVALKGGDLDDEIAVIQKIGYVRDVTSKHLTFIGAENIPGVEKKIVSVHFSETHKDSRQ